MKKALIIVDYQYDFVADDGALTVGKAAQDIQVHLKNLARDYDEKDIYFTFDDHDFDDWKNKKTPEADVFNEHCINGTKGYQIYGDIKGKDNVVNHVNKKAYCPKQDFLDGIIKKYNDVTVVGLVTDICVFQTVIGLYTVAVNSGKKININVDPEACASFNPDREKWSLQYLEQILGVNVK
ncbi:cysteine hydrolase family protein [Metaclostridioides mangenotii]|uniref:Nicotinamidase-related amidase n=1 Tax=Metaclostridioides mangenotii TaxID=1540 RepID=A0ABS4EDA8_9FIRM|nr:cysteine hydrolase family protein [Clostridioides mangenotii]MBP1855912.1 nicotinamidase-related amidase [Clostridioides mangenotii]